MPSLALLVELTESKKNVAPLVSRMSAAGPPVALMLSVPAPSTVTVLPLAMSSAAVAPEVVVGQVRAGPVAERRVPVVLS